LKRMKKNLKKLLLYLVSFCLSLELIARIDEAITKWRSSPSFETIQIKDEFGFRGVPYGRWGDIVLNKYGFNDSDDYTKEEKKRALRIICLGDSITFGTLTAPYNWVFFLKKLFAEKGVDAEVINASMPGNTFPQLVDRLEAEHIEFNPDILLIYKGFRYYMASEKDIYIPEKSFWEKGARKSTFIRKILDHQPRDPHRRLLKERKRRGIRDLIEEVTEEQLDRYRHDLMRLIRFCRDRRITVVLASFPFLVNEDNREKYIDFIYSALYFYPTISAEAYIKGIPQFNEVTREVASREKVMYVDISKGLDRTGDYFLDRSHLTPKGSKRVAKNYAEALVRYIKSLPLIPARIRDDAFPDRELFPRQ